MLLSDGPFYLGLRTEEFLELHFRWIQNQFDVDKSVKEGPKFTSVCGSN